MSNKKKIKEILEKIKSHYVIIDTEGTGDTGAEKALQEYGQWVRQQTLEEAIDEVKIKPLAKGKRAELIFGDLYKYFQLGAKEERKQTLSNLQALKDKN